jgi:hypothetical protein
MSVALEAEEIARRLVAGEPLPKGTIFVLNGPIRIPGQRQEPTAS